MNITSVRIHLVNNNQSGTTTIKFRGYAEVVFDDCFIVKGMRILEGPDHTYVGMPSRKRPNGEFTDICHPLNKQFHAQLETAILDEYERVLNQSGDPV